MANAVLAALALASATSLAQAPAPETSKPAPAATSAAPTNEELARDLEAARKEIKDMREEVRAQLATQAATEGWQDEWVQEKRKLELFTVDGYFRTRPELFHNLGLGRANDPDPSGYTLFPRSPHSVNESTMSGVNMRLRMDPTLNVSEEVRIRAQIDFLDNVVFGSNPDYAFSRSDRNSFGIWSETQVPPRSAINDIQDSVSVKRVYGEVSTPFGILRFGRMGSHWGTGMLYNDGNCINCDAGLSVDRLQLVTEPIPGSGYYIAPMVDFNVEGPTSAVRGSLANQPFDLTNNDDSHSFILAIAKRDTDQQMKAKLENGGSIFNFGAYFTYRVQRSDPEGFYQAGPNAAGVGGNAGNTLTPGFTGTGQELGAAALYGQYVTRNGALYIPDLWAKFENKTLTIEVELAAVGGNVTVLPYNETDPAKAQVLSIVQFGAVAKGQYRLLNQALKIGLEVGFASGDRAPGFGNRPGRRSQNSSSDPDNNPATANNWPAPGDIDGAQYACSRAGGCSDASIRNFRFNSDYRIDLILWREILGNITDAVYVRPSADYRITEGLHIFGAIIYSRAIYAESTPSYTNPNLGVELNVGASYETDDGFFASLQWGILFPLEGLKNTYALPAGTAPDLQTAQALRAMLGIKF